MEKRKDPKKHLRRFLEHLESNMFNEKKRSEEILHKSFHNVLGRLTSFCIEGDYIKKTRETIEGKKVEVCSLRPNGLIYLESLRNFDRDKQRDNLQIILVFATSILSLSAIIQLFEFLKGGLSIGWSLFFSLLILLVTLIYLRRFLNKG